MCTVAIVPAADGFVLGHNRDESIRRARGVPPEVRHVRATTVLAPIDPEAGGTWVTVNDRGVAVCVLNAREAAGRAIPSEPYSRGLVALEAAAAGGLDQVAALLDPQRLAEARAFDLVAVAFERASGATRATIHRWDGCALRVEPLAVPCMRASSLLDPLGADRARRRSWERLLAAHPAPGVDELARWLATHEPEPGARSICVHRPDARTVSRTLVAVGPLGARMRYLDGAPCDTAAIETVRFLPWRPDQSR